MVASSTASSAVPTRERPALILASASPRRLALLEQIGLPPDEIRPADIDETPQAGELPRPYAARMAREKAEKIARETTKPALILGSDTVIAVGRRILPKALDEDTARHCLSLLSGRRHKVLTSVVCCPSAAWPEGHHNARLVETSVIFNRLTSQQIDALIAQGDWHGKAGGYALQGAAAAYIRQISGSASGVVGLPLFETAQLLRGQPCPAHARWLP
ncbi:Maf family protein [Saccharibacter floricola]|uniref:Maf family protein n=1 Tax=Saccharibacter floricola TaxID=231053 RepID=UPI00037A89B6|nr:Maf family nucleotide pyrophosphatase [Saccharibacter floricola]